MSEEEDINAALEVADTAYKAAIVAKDAAWDAYSTVTRLACSNTALKAAWDAYSTADTAKDAARDAYEAARDAARDFYQDPLGFYFTYHRMRKALIDSDKEAEEIDAYKEGEPK